MSNCFASLRPTDMGLDRVLRFACTLRPCRLPATADQRLLESPPDFLADASALTGPSPILLQDIKKCLSYWTGNFLMAEDMGLEPTGLLHLT